jgi:hypothetical protein
MDLESHPAGGFYNDHEKLATTKPDIKWWDYLHWLH